MENIHRLICKYIYENWIGESNRQFGIAHNIDERTVREIKNNENYSMTIETLEKICQGQDITLSEFFKRIKR